MKYNKTSIGAQLEASSAAETHLDEEKCDNSSSSKSQNCDNSTENQDKIDSAQNIASKGVKPETVEVSTPLNVTKKQG